MMDITEDRGVCNAQGHEVHAHLGANDQMDSKQRSSCIWIWGPFMDLCIGIQGQGQLYFNKVVDFVTVSEKCNEQSQSNKVTDSNTIKIRFQPGKLI